MGHDPLSTGSGSQSVNPLLYNGVKQDTAPKSPPNKAVEISKAALSELKNTDSNTKLDETHKLKKQELNGDGQNHDDLETEKKTHGVGTNTLLPENGSSEDVSIKALQSNEVYEEVSADSVENTTESESESDSVKEEPDEDMSDEELEALMQGEIESQNTINKQKEEKLQKKQSLKAEITTHSSSITKGDYTIAQIRKMIHVLENGVFRNKRVFDESQPIVNQEQELLDFLDSHKDFVMFEGKGHRLRMPETMKEQFAGMDHITVEDEDGQLVEVPMSEVDFLGAEEFRQFVDDIREHVTKLQRAPTEVKEKEAEEKETKHEVAHGHQPQQQVAGQQNKPDATKNDQDRRPFAKAEGAEKHTRLSIAEINQRRIDEFNEYMSVKMDKIRKKIKQEELTEEHIKHDELKSSIKKTDTQKHETHVDIAQTDAEFKQLQQKFMTLSDTTFTVPARKIFKELQVILEKINMKNPNDRKTVALKKEIVDIARELVKFSNDVKGVSEGSERLGG